MCVWFSCGLYGANPTSVFFRKGYLHSNIILYTFPCEGIQYIITRQIIIRNYKDYVLKSYVCIYLRTQVNNNT